MPEKETHIDDSTLSQGSSSTNVYYLFERVHYACKKLDRYHLLRELGKKYICIRWISKFNLKKDIPECIRFNNF